MITIEKLNIFNQYLGDIDAFARIGTSQEKQIVLDQDWIFIDNLIQDIRLMNKGLLSNDMIYKTKKKMEDSIPDLEARDLIISMAQK